MLQVSFQVADKIYSKVTSLLRMQTSGLQVNQNIVTALTIIEIVLKMHE